MILVASQRETALTEPPPRLKTSPRKFASWISADIKGRKHVFDEQNVAYLFAIPAEVG